MKITMKIIGAIEKFIKAASILAGLITIGLMIMICVDIIFRLLGSSIVGSVEIVAMSVPVIVFMGTAYTALTEMNIRVDIIKFWPLMDRVGNLLCIGAIGVSGWYCLMQALQTREIGVATTILKMQRWPVMLVTALGMLLVAVAMILNEVKAYIKIHQKRKGKKAGASLTTEF